MGHGVVEHPDKTVVFLFREQKDTQKKTTMAAELDMMNRDPNNINPHLKVGFEDIFGEPEDIRSMECVWKNSYKCFECWKQLCYTIMTFCCGICIAMEWGCEFAYIAFTHIWFVSPCFKCLEINCGCCQKLYGLCVHCMLDPWSGTGSDGALSRRHVRQVTEDG